MKRILVSLVSILLIVAITGCSSAAKGNPTDYAIGPLQIGISKHPERGNIGGGVLKSLPRYNPNSTNAFQVDLRGSDLSQLSVVDRLSDLLHADFDSATKWPEQLPDGFDPSAIMELGKDPGFNIGKLHEKGITGKGVGIAIIDQTLLVDHVEYRDRLKHYEEIHNTMETSTMHGAAVASIAVGKTVGVAPESDLYYIADTYGNYTALGTFSYDFTWLAKAVDRVVEINNTLPEESKIRVIAMQIGWNSEQKGYQDIVDAVERAKATGVFVVSSSLWETYDNTLYFHGLGRDPNADPNVLDSYGPGSWWAASFFSRKTSFKATPLLFPMDSRCTASPTGVNDYVFYAQGGWSWSIPYIAGLYALACQVKPDVTPDEFWSTGLTTGDAIKIDKDDQTFGLGTIVNPQKLIAKLAEK